jgi:hypothetical protein
VSAAAYDRAKPRRWATSAGAACPKPEPPRPLVRPAEPADLTRRASWATSSRAPRSRSTTRCGPARDLRQQRARRDRAGGPRLRGRGAPDGPGPPDLLYVFSVAASGERKSSTDNEALAPVDERERELRGRHDQELEPYEADLAAWKAERQAILADRKVKGRTAKAEAIQGLGQPPAAPLLPMLTAPEPTYEGLCRLLDLGQPSVGVFSAEGGQFIGGHAMNAENKLKTAAALSDLWDKGLVKRLRAGDGAKILPAGGCRCT